MERAEQNAPASRAAGAVGPTPGPWSIYMDNLHQFVVRKMFDDGQEAHAIARVSGSSEVPAIANARLIAAAPDLLAALEEARNYIILCAPHSGDTSGKGWGHVMDVTGAALSKARGLQEKQT